MPTNDETERAVTRRMNHQANKMISLRSVRVAIVLCFLTLVVLGTGCGRVGSAAPVNTVQATAAIELPAPTHAPTQTQAPTLHPTETPTLLPTATSTSTSLPAPTATRTPLPTRTPTPDPVGFVNGVPVEHFIIMPPETRANVRQIFGKGQQLGRNPNAFSKVGDSISLTSHYFARFDQKRYDLGIYQELQDTIDYYDGSFERFGVALQIGLHAWIAFRPGVADQEKCEVDEHMVECELRLHNPSVLLIRLGTNDTASGDAYERAIRFAIEYSMENGVIPVLVTKSDRFEGDDRHNNTMRALALEYRIPLWDFDIVAGTLPDRGLGGDDVHLTMYATNDYTDPATLSFGYPLSDLTGLMMLDAIRQTVTLEDAE